LEDVIWTVAKKIDIILRSNYPPKTCLASLAEKIDIDRWTLFSLSVYGGNKPALGRIEGNEFRLHKRRYWHNSFAPVLFGRVTEDGRGTVVEAYWDTWRGASRFHSHLAGTSHHTRDAHLFSFSPRCDPVSIHCT
jgi:hypothetical protein